MSEFINDKYTLYSDGMKQTYRRIIFVVYEQCKIKLSECKYPTDKILYNQIILRLFFCSFFDKIFKREYMQAQLQPYFTSI